MPFTPAVSLSVDCGDQAEIDRLWDAFSAEGGTPGRCGWLTDRFGLAWQIVPGDTLRSIWDAGPEGSARMMTAVVGMDKLDIAALERARDGG